MIELLVVIAIIAIIAAILFPVFAGARDKARASACISNLKQIGLAYSQYEQDYDETVPCGNRNYDGGQGWAGQIFPYVKSVGVFLCPSDTGVGDVISYGLNWNLVGTTAANNVLPVQIAQMNAPASSVMLFEVVNSSGWTFKDGADSGSSPVGNGSNHPAWCSLTGTNNPGNPCSTTATSLKYATGVLYNTSAANVPDGTQDKNPADITGTNSYFTAATGRHQNGSNFLLADCHAKFLQPGKVGAGYDVVSSGVDDFSTCPGVRDWTAPSTSCANPTTLAATFAIR